MWLTQRVFLASLFFIFLSVFVLPPPSAHSAATLYVGPGEEHQTIQAGIDAAVDGDTVIVRDGTYSGEGNREITFAGKAITVRSENGAARCIIDGTDGEGNGFVFKRERISSVLSGFTIKNFGTGIYCHRVASPTITHCTISGNGRYGVQITDFSAPSITNTIIWENILEEIMVPPGGWTPLVTYSCILGGYPGEGNISSNPRFLSLPRGSYT